MDTFRVELKGVFSPEINRPELPDDPECCIVLMCADIGTRGSEAADQFNFTVVTPKFLVLNPETRWGNGYLIMPEFSWLECERMLRRLISGINANTWSEAAAALGKYLDWEFENYTNY